MAGKTNITTHEWTRRIEQGSARAVRASAGERRWRRWARASGRRWRLRSFLVLSFSLLALLLAFLARIRIGADLTSVVLGCLGTGMVGALLCEPYLPDRPRSASALVDAVHRWRRQLVVLGIFVGAVALTAATGSAIAGEAGVGLGVLALLGWSHRPRGTRNRAR